MRYLLISVILFGTWNVSFADSKTQIKKDLHALCMSRFSRTLDKRKVVCDCSVKNLTQNNSDKELLFIYRVLENKKAPQKLNDEQIMLVEFSRNVSEKCLENPKWVVGQ